MSDAHSSGASSRGLGGLLGKLLGTPYHQNYIVGVIDDAERAGSAVAGLRNAGFATDDVVARGGQEVEDRMQSESFAVALREATTEAGSICMDYNEMARDGSIVSVYTRSDAELERARNILSAHGAHNLKYFGDWTIQDLPSGPAHGPGAH